tara:strand:+ start:635 stop:799 length:165 start_codon:yes stop_codon:yes gene_type:complete
MASILEIKQMGSILQRKSRGRIWNNDISGVDKKDNKKVKKKGHFNKHWDKDLWD